MEAASTRTFGDHLAAIALTAGVAAIGAAVALGIVWLTGDASTSSGGASSWNSIAIVDPVSGELTVHDAAGERLETIEFDIEFPEVVQVSSAHLLFLGSRDDGFAIELIDLATGDVDDVLREIPADDGRLLRAFAMPGADVAVIGSDASPGSMYLVNVDGDVLDIADEARWEDPFLPPLAARATADGRAVAISDLSRGDTETAIVNLADFDVEVVDGVLAAVTEDGVVTRSRNGDDTETVRFYDADGTELDEFDVDAFRVASVDDDGGLVTATEAGDITRWTSDGPELLADVDVDPDARFPTVVANLGPDFLIAAIDADGRPTVVTGTGTIFDDLDIDGTAERVDPGGDCFTVITTSSIALVDASSGEVIAEEQRSDDLFVTLPLASVDRCTVLAAGRDAVLLGADVDVRLRRDDVVVGLSPDGGTYAVRDDLDSVEIAATDGSGESIEIDRSAFRVVFVQR